MKTEKKPLDQSHENPWDAHPLMLISRSLDQAALLLGQSMNTCSYIRRFNILMYFVNDKKKSL